MAKPSRRTEFDYDVTLSFAGENRLYVERVADRLVGLGVRVFYDKYDEVDLWGKDLYSHLSDLYRFRARYCVMFISRHYAKKLWPSHERRSAQERAFRENREYILPARFDNTAVPGLLDTTGYITLGRRRPENLAAMIARKVIDIPRHDYFPNGADVLEQRLRKEFRLRSQKSIDAYTGSAYRFFKMLSRLRDDERELIFRIILHGCSAELPDNMHIDLEMLRRVSRFSRARMETIANNIRPLGFSIYYRRTDRDGPRPHANPSVAFEWHDLNDSRPPHPTSLAALVVRTGMSGMCDHCGLAALMRLDFSQMSSAVASSDSDLMESLHEQTVAERRRPVAR